MKAFQLKRLPVLVYKSATAVIGMLFFIFLTSPVTAQSCQKLDLFENEEIFEMKLTISFKEVKKVKDKKERAPTVMYFSEEEGLWDSLDVEVRARGNFRRQRCFFPPLKIRIKKKIRKGGMFENHKHLKLVLPCNDSPGGDELLIKEYLAYKLYEKINQYHFKSRLINIELTDISGRQPKSFTVKGILLEDDKVVASRFDGRIAQDVQITPFRLHDTTAVKHDFFQFMIANTDWSAVAQHNSTLIMVDNKYISMPYDFDMAGMVNAPYATVNESLSITSVRQRLYRGVCYDSGIFQVVRNEYLDKEARLWEIIENNTAQLNPKEASNLKKFLEEFFEILKDDKKFNSQLLAACRSMD